MNGNKRGGFGGAPKKSEDDDLYEGYNDLESRSAALASTIAATAAKDSMIGGYGGGAGTLAPIGSVRPGTGAMAGGSDGPRPMTSVKGAGYSSAGNKKSVFDPFQQAAQGPAPPLQQKTADSPENQAKEMEKQVNRLLEESSKAGVEKDFLAGLEKAKEAAKRERMLCRHREKNGLGDQINVDLTYAICFNLANQYHANGMFTEALNTYAQIVKNKQYPQAGRLRVNMGNIYFQQKKYPAAIKMYRMAMDQIGHMSKDMKFKIMRNIGVSFVKLGQFQDAIQSFEAVMEANPDAQTGFNLIICYFALGDKEKMKKGLTQLLCVPEFGHDDEEEEVSPKSSEEANQNDELKKERLVRLKVLHRYVHLAAKLVAPVLDKSFSDGYDIIIELLRNPPRRPNSPKTGSDVGRTTFVTTAMEMEIAKGVAYLKRKDIQKAIEVLKGFEKKDVGMIGQAATNLAFLYFLEGDMKNSEKYAEMAVRSDRYNAKALVNKANHMFVKGDLDGAKELYLEAIGVEADCVEAIYNLGLANKKLNHLEDALQAFKKLHRIVPKDPQVVYHIANLYEILGDNNQATEWFKILHGVVPNDPKILARLGTLYSKEDDETQAFHNFSDSYNLYPVNMEVISWLGVWFVKSELYEDAIQFFERAAEIEPHEVKWQLMVASCYRRMGNYQQALILYKRIHKQDPNNIECLKYLATICKDLNDSQYEEFSKLLRQAERQQQAKDNRFYRDDVQDDPNAKNDQEYARNSPVEKDITPPEGSPEVGQRGLMSPRQQRDMENSYVDEGPGPKMAGKTINHGGGRKDEVDWNDETLGDDLLPM